MCATKYTDTLAKSCDNLHNLGNRDSVKEA